MEIRGLHVVVVGGGTGSYSVLSGLKHYVKNLTALVNMADDGGSTGALRDELGVLPPGDARQCLVALSQSPKVGDLFNYRFEEGALKGHAFGNLFLTALEKMTGNFAEGIEMASEVLRVQGKVIPVTLDNVRLKMTWPKEHLELRGEGVIDVEHFQHDPRQATLRLEPSAKANPAAIEAILQADVVMIAPGDLYTSIGPILIAEGFSEALASTHARVVYICNLVTKKGQTHGFDVADHVAEIERFAGGPVIDTVLYNSVQPSRAMLERYAKEGEFWVEENTEALRNSHFRAVSGNFLARHTPEVTKADPLAAHRNFIRHDPDKLARALMKLYFE